MLVGAALLAVGQVYGVPSFWTFVLPMWIIAIGMVLAVSVAANGALQAFGEVAGTAVALHFCVQSLFATGIGTLLVLLLQGDTAWPLIAYCTLMAGATLVALTLLHRRGPGPDPAPDN